MVDLGIASLLEGFRSSWTRFLGIYPKLNLDLSWPSIGTVDLLTTPLRLKGSFSTSEHHIIRSASAYIGVIVHDCWSLFPHELDVQLKLSDDEAKDILITVRGGPHLPHRQTFSVNITAVLSQILSTPPNPFPVFESLTRPLAPTHNLLSLFASGLCSGLTPWGSGPWRELSADQFKENLGAHQPFLATTCAEYYRNVFPSEEHGQKPELYLAGLLLPPALYNEDFPGVRAVSSLIKYLREAGVKDTALPRLASNLAQSPDELISSVGCALACAVHDTVSPQLNLTLQSKDAYLPQLRPAVMIARKLLGKPHDWVQLIEQGDIETARRVMELDRSFGLLPFLKLSGVPLAEKAFHPLYNALAWGELDTAKQLVDRLAMEGAPYLAELLLQGLYLDLYRNEPQSAVQKLEILSADLENQSEASQAIVYQAKATVARAQGRLRDALDACEHSLKALVSPATTSAAELFLETLLDLGEREGAARVAPFLTEHYPHSLRVGISAVRTYLGVNQLEAAGLELKRVLSSAPASRSAVLELLALHSLTAVPETSAQ